MLRLATSAAMAGHLFAATPVLAQELTQATVKASVQAATDVTSVVERGAERTVRKSQRLVADAQRKLRKASVRVNRTVPKVTPPVLEPAFGVNVTTEMISRARVFEEPLIPVGEPTADDNRALGQLLQTIALAVARSAGDAHRHLSSRTIRVRRGVRRCRPTAGVLYAREGYYSRAASYWAAGVGTDARRHRARPAHHRGLHGRRSGCRS